MLSFFLSTLTESLPLPVLFSYAGLIMDFLCKAIDIEHSGSSNPRIALKLELNNNTHSEIPPQETS
jgi:hypothetical protein